MEINKDTFPGILKTKMQELGFNNSSLARKAGVSRDQVRKIFEKGTIPIGEATVKILAAVGMLSFLGEPTRTTTLGWQCPQCCSIYSPAVEECKRCAPKCK